MTRAERIHRRERYKAKVVRVLKYVWGLRGESAVCLFNRPDVVGRYTQHGLKLCSCHMCGNPRRFGGRDTRDRQERLADLKLEEFEAEFTGM